MLKKTAHNGGGLGFTDFNDIFRDLSWNVNRIVLHYEEGSNRLVECAFQVMDELRLVRHDVRKSAMLNNKFEQLVQEHDGLPANIFTKKEIGEADVIVHSLEGGKGQPNADLSFGGAKQQDNQQLLDDFTFSPMHQSLIKPLSIHTKDLKEPLSQPIPKKPEGKKYVRLENSIKALREKINEYNAEPEEPQPEPQKVASSNVDIEELINSTRKLGLQTKKQVDEDEDVQYEMTDYSSNESSNDDNNYQVEYKDDDDFQDASFGFQNQYSCPSQESENIFAGNSQPNPHPVIFNFDAFKHLKKAESSITTFEPQFKPNSLLKSPIKSPSKRKKRMYCRNKRIPFWAEDLSKVALSNRGKNPNKIFGRCVVENLNAEYMFPTADDAKDHVRSSSAKWSYEH